MDARRATGNGRPASANREPLNREPLNLTFQYWYFCSVAGPRTCPDGNVGMLI